MLKTEFIILLPYLLLSIAWKLPFLLVVAIVGLWRLRHAPHTMMRQRAVMALWILLGAHILHWVLHKGPTFFGHDLVNHLLFQDRKHGILDSLIQCLDFGIIMLQALSYWLLLRIVVQAVRKLPVAVAKEQEHNV